MGKGSLEGSQKIQNKFAGLLDFFGSWRQIVEESTQMQFRGLLWWYEFITRHAGVHDMTQS